jgi:putative protein-disulfide isomerase
MKTKSSPLITKLYYFHDPMCSWCWAFGPLWNAIIADLPDNVVSQRVLGGLAPDTDQVMPTDMQSKLRSIWQKIQQTVPETQFNYEFWDKCVPRRSTYAACRAVIAAKQQNPAYEETMIMAIQRAYYLEARNPADMSTLIELANEIGLDQALFSADMQSSAIQQALLKEIEFTHSLEVKGFPTLLLEKEGTFTAIHYDYSDVNAVLLQIKRLSQ